MVDPAQVCTKHGTGLIVESEMERQSDKSLFMRTYHGPWHGANLIIESDVERQSDESLFVGTVEIRYNGLEGTWDFWLLNPNVVKSNYPFLVFFVKKKN